MSWALLEICASERCSGIDTLNLDGSLLHFLDHRLLAHHLMLLIYVLEPLLLVLGHEIPCVEVAPAALVARLEVLPVSLTTRTRGCTMLSS